MGRINHLINLRDTISGKATLLDMLLCHFPIRRDVDAVNLIRGDITLDPLDLAAQLKDGTGLLRRAEVALPSSFLASGSSRSITYFVIVFSGCTAFCSEKCVKSIRDLQDIRPIVGTGNSQSQINPSSGSFTGPRYWKPHFSRIRVEAFPSGSV